MPSWSLSVKGAPMTRATAKEGRSKGQGGWLDSIANISPGYEPCGSSGVEDARVTDVGSSRRASLHRLQQRLTLRPSYRTCGTFSVMPDGGLIARGGVSPSLSGLNACGSSGCARCAHRREAENGSEIEHILRSALEAGGTVLFCTFTASNRGHAPTSAGLRALYEQLHRAWDLSFGSSWWRSRAELYGALGFVRVTETQIRHEAGAEGFHPHIHAALVCDRELSADEVRTLSLMLERRWIEAAPRRGLVVSVDAQEVKRANDADLAGYIAKGAALELSRSVVKGGRSSVSWLGLLSLIQDAGGGEEYDRLVRLYRAYEAGSKGRRTLSVARALRERYGAPEDEAGGDAVEVELETEDAAPDPDEEPIALPPEIARAMFKTKTRPELLYLLGGREFVRSLREYVKGSSGVDVEGWRVFLGGWLEGCLLMPHGLPGGLMLPDEVAAAGWVVGKAKRLREALP